VRPASTSASTPRAFAGRPVCRKYQRNLDHRFVEKGTVSAPRRAQSAQIPAFQRAGRPVTATLAPTNDLEVPAVGLPASAGRGGMNGTRIVGRRPPPAGSNRFVLGAPRVQLSSITSNGPVERPRRIVLAVTAAASARLVPVIAFAFSRGACGVGEGIPLRVLWRRSCTGHFFAKSELFVAALGRSDSAGVSCRCRTGREPGRPRASRAQRRFRCPLRV
jgi:hypothetical protein